jgi:hypothetical protein
MYANPSILAYLRSSLHYEITINRVTLGITLVSKFAYNRAHFGYSNHQLFES